MMIKFILFHKVDDMANPDAYKPFHVGMFTKGKKKCYG